MKAKFVLSKEIVLEQVKKLEEFGLKISYSYKTNKEVGNILQELSGCSFSIHAEEEIDLIKDKQKIWFFTQAETNQELINILDKGVRNFVVDNEVDLGILLEAVDKRKINVNLSLRMKFQEHRIGTGKYFVYGISCKRINELIKFLGTKAFVENLGIHIHRKSQNTSEWNIKEELEDSLSQESLKLIDFVNFGGGLPSKYRGYSHDVDLYIFNRIAEAKEFLNEKKIEVWIEPGRFIAAPAIRLEVEIIQIQGKNIIVNTSIYRCALDTLITGTKMLIKGELEKGREYLIKGNSPTRDDIFRYRVGLENPKVGDKIVFLNAGAYNYSTDFFGYNKLDTEIVETF
ncbi:MAG: decarboxylase [archaeon]